jgi:hypothetical protein
MKIEETLRDATGSTSAKSTEASTRRAEWSPPRRAFTASLMSR